MERSEHHILGGLGVMAVQGFSRIRVNSSSDRKGNASLDHDHAVGIGYGCFPGIREETHMGHLSTGPV